MISIDCARARRRMDQRVAGLNHAERLRLEDHLATCAACLQQSHALHAIQHVMSEGVAPPSEAAQRRVIARAIAEASQGASNQRTSRGSLQWSALAAVCALSFVALAAWRLRLTEDPKPTPALVTSTQASAPARVSTERLVIADAAGRADVEGAELTLVTGTRALWNADTATLRIERGQVSAHVQPRGAQIPFRVVTREFVVVVVGTRFVVTHDRVEVTEGSVRIERPDHAAVLLRAGEAWPPASTSVSELSPFDLLAQARARLARGDVTGARNTVERARRTVVSRALRAEAETLLAECDQVEGKLSAAIDRYLVVAANHRNTGAGDNAAYAAARLALTQRDARARDLLRRYLEHYPNGRFRHDAQAAFDRLSASSASSASQAGAR